jgi:hypothetical protein
LPAGVEGQRGVLCAKDDSRRITLPLQQYKENCNLTALTITLNGNDYDGFARIRLRGEPAAFLRYQLSSLGTKTTHDFIREVLSEYSLSPDLDTFTIENHDNHVEPVTCTMKISKKNAVIKVSDQIVCPIVFYTPREFSAVRNQTSRLNNIYFPYPYLHQDLIKMVCPKGMRVFKLPEKQNYVTTWGEFDLTSYICGDTIIVQRAYTIKERIIFRDNFDEFKKFASLVVDSGNNPIILTK